MCQSPALLPNGTQIACRKCWQCIENRRNDWVGRCLAEKEYAAKSHFITLTYGRVDGSADHIRAALLTYSDVQKWFKRLRRAGYQFRYLVAGEYGSTKGRAHWHVLMFWEGDCPPHEPKLWHDDFWPHGHQDWSEITLPSVRYVCKYITKSEDADDQSLLRMSKRPPIGAHYFIDLAKRYVKNGLAPQEPFYKFAGVKDTQGRAIKFYLKGATLDIFLTTFVREWAAQRGGHMPNSTFVEEWCDKQLGERNDFAMRDTLHKMGKPWLDPPFGEMTFSESVNNWYVRHPETNEVLWWSYGIRGLRNWESAIRTQDEGKRLLELPYKPQYARDTE